MGREEVHMQIWEILRLRGARLQAIYLPEPGTLVEKIEETGRGAGLIFVEHPLGARYCIKYLICIIYIMTLVGMRKQIK